MQKLSADKKKLCNMRLHCSKIIQQNLHKLNIPSGLVLSFILHFTFHGISVLLSNDRMHDGIINSKGNGMKKSRSN